MKPLYSEVGRWFGLHGIKIGASEGFKQINNLIRLIHKIIYHSDSQIVTFT